MTLRNAFISIDDFKEAGQIFFIRYVFENCLIQDELVKKTLMTLGAEISEDLYRGEDKISFSFQSIYKKIYETMKKNRDIIERIAISIKENKNIKNDLDQIDLIVAETLLNRGLIK